MLGKLLDRRYRIVKELAEGGFSQTYLAEDTRLPKNPQCVVKHLNPTIDDPVFTQKALELFKAEAETLQELGKHDLIPQLYAYFQENKEFYLVQEFIAGHPLSKEMSPGSQMAEARVAQIVKEVLEILQFVHKYNVIHRDIKPSNLIRRHSDGKLVLIDFGTVKQVQMEVASAHHKARVTLPIGTPGYMSYEQERGQSVSCSDIYSLGMVALQALTGKHPSQFPRDRDYEINWRSYAKVSREFAAVLDRMTRCNPRDRYQTVDEVLRDMARLPKLSTASPRITDDRDEVKPNTWLLPSAIALLALAGGTYLLITGWNPFKSNILPSNTPSLSISTPTSAPTIAPSPSVVVPPSPIPMPDRKISYAQLSSYLQAKNWKAADLETYLLLLKAAGSQSDRDGTFHPDEFNRISCADLVLVDQLWTQASNGKQGLTAQKKIYEDFAKDIRKTYENIGWLSPTGELAIDTAYDRQTARWEYIEGRQPNFKSPPVGHLPFLLRDSNKNLERMATLYRCSS
ncbi:MULTISPECIES: protein kinase domain-containing protein [Pseudanabaena]|jgi:serine/threonine protein kinase|uniref:protein kinase domain-containing protein n=1 Tax=Pseudanabaena TaxID=1152 RepID=UPI002479727F|nr:MULTISPECIES: GUN4 domain-containing protein [Pseudanabaena]MEA5487506.1 GUN4 domain-containing protein [Pseudanabaena sp. CCNP1317]WGS74018.1 GUN4 domain-containing protein [Pseudanabaena galeata CCNP1313]